MSVGAVWLVTAILNVFSIGYNSVREKINPDLGTVIISIALAPIVFVLALGMTFADLMAKFNGKGEE